MNPPKKNSRHVIHIREATAKGFGIGYIGEFALFAEGGLPGDVVDCLLVKIKKRYAYGKILNIITPSPFRIKSPCPVSKTCGGCQWQHCNYAAQLDFKKKIVTDALVRIGGLANPPVFDVIGMENPARYRNKAVFPVVPHAKNIRSKNNDGFAIGMFAPRSHRLIEVNDCIIQHEAHVKILAALKDHMRRKKISAYDETTHKGLVRHIVIRTSFSCDDIMVVLVINGKSGNSGKSLPGAEEFAQSLADLGVSTVLLSFNATKGNTILGDAFQILHGTGFIRESLGEVEYRLSAPSFFQVNPVQTKVLYDTAIAQAGLSPGAFAIDAHAGVGGVALFAAKNGAEKVIGVDIVAEAIADAKKNAALNGILNAEFICGAAEEIIPKILENATPQPDVIFLDPPRKGNDPALLSAIIAAKIPKIVYISCDPATLARDIKILISGGYSLKAAQPVDMFPFTGKVETCVLVSHERTD